RRRLPTMSLFSWLGVPRRGSRRPTTKSSRSRPPCRLRLEPLEDRCLPSATLVADIVPGPVSSFPAGLTNVNGTLYFLTHRGDSVPRAPEIWKSDGTAAGTVLVHKFGLSSPSNFTALNGSVYFSNSDPLDSGLFKIDSTQDSPVLVKSVFTKYLTRVN